MFIVSITQSRRSCAVFWSCNCSNKRLISLRDSEVCISKCRFAFSIDFIIESICVSSRSSSLKRVFFLSAFSLSSSVSGEALSMTSFHEGRRFLNTSRASWFLLAWSRMMISIKSSIHFTIDSVKFRIRILIMSCLASENAARVSSRSLSSSSFVSCSDKRKRCYLIPFMEFHIVIWESSEDFTMLVPPLVSVILGMFSNDFSNSVRFFAHPS